MAEPKGSRGKGSGLTRKVGGQPLWAWPAELVAAFLVYRWYKNRQAAQSGAIASTAPASTIGAGLAGAVQSSSSLPTPTSWQAWLQDALSMGGGSGAIYNDIVNWMNGGCVSSAGYGVISQAIASLGVPPGGGVPSTIAVCPQTTAPTTTPATSAAPGPASSVPSGALSLPIPAGASGINPNGFYQLSLQAAQAALNAGWTLYQNGAEANAFAQAHGQPVNPAVNPAGYYALSPAAAANALKTGLPVYQSGGEAIGYAIQHPAA